MGGDEWLRNNSQDTWRQHKWRCISRSTKDQIWCSAGVRDVSWLAVGARLVGQVVGLTWLDSFEYRWCCFLALLLSFYFFRRVLHVRWRKLGHGSTWPVLLYSTRQSVWLELGCKGGGGVSLCHDPILN